MKNNEINFGDLDETFAAVKPQLEQDRELVREICEIDSGLSDYAVEFVESVARRVIGDGLELTTQQRQFAEKLASDHS